jgi:hypothetical protein
MDQPTISDLAITASHNLELLEAELATGRRPLAQLERILFFASRWHRVGAISAFLASGDPRKLHAGLARSADARVQLLTLRQQHALPYDRFTGTAELDPLSDAIAACADAAAAEIARLSSPRIVEDEELEEEFWFGRFLIWAVSGSSADEGARIVQELERTAEPDGCLRLDVCRALLERSQDAFDASLRCLMSDRELRYRDLASIGGSDPRTMTERFVSVEGIALVRLAERAGLRPEEEYRLVPGISRWRAPSTREVRPGPHEGA